eukprot:3556668-Prymnesium_polylepis.1
MNWNVRPRSQGDVASLLREVIGHLCGRLRAEGPLLASQVCGGRRIVVGGGGGAARIAQNTEQRVWASRA